MPKSEQRQKPVATTDNGCNSVAPKLFSFPERPLIPQISDSEREGASKIREMLLTVAPDFLRGLFTEPEIESVLRLQNHAVIRLLSGLTSRVKEWDLESLVKLLKCETDIELKTLIADNPSHAANYLPFVANQFATQISLSTLLEHILLPQGDWERDRGLLRWLPLIAPYLETNTSKVMSGPERLIRNLIAAEQPDEGDPVLCYINLSRFVTHWKGEVSESCYLEICKKIREYNCDIDLFHSVPLSEIPKDIRQERITTYVEKDLQSTPITAQVQRVLHQNQYAGTCAWADGLHQQIMLEQKGYEKGRCCAAIIRVEGVPTFVLKLIRDPSMVALRTLRSSEETFACIRGGLYVPEQKFTKDIKEVASQCSDFFCVIDAESPVSAFALGWIDNVNFAWNKPKRDAYLAALTRATESFLNSSGSIL